MNKYKAYPVVFIPNIYNGWDIYFPNFIEIGNEAKTFPEAYKKAKEILEHLNKTEIPIGSLDYNDALEFMEGLLEDYKDCPIESGFRKSIVEGFEVPRVLMVLINC